MNEQVAVVKELINLVEESEIAELRVDFKGVSVEITKYPCGHGMPMMPPQHHQIHTAAPGVEGKSGQAEAPAEPKGTPVVSPLAGVFYAAPKPGAPNFVKVGDQVEVGDTLCIIEAMKIMNEITSEVKGKVVKVCKENSDVANEGEALFYIET